MAKPAFQLRKATIEDFHDYYYLQLHSHFHWLMFDKSEFEEKETDQKNADSKSNFFFSEEDLKMITDYYVKFNREQFVDEFKWYRIFMVIIDHKVVGYVKLEPFNGRLILREWPMAFDYRDSELLEAMLEKIETLRSAKCKAIQVIARAQKSRDFLIRLGYKEKLQPFFEKSFQEKDGTK